MTTMSGTTSVDRARSSESVAIGEVLSGVIDVVADGLPEPLTTKLIVPHQGYVLPRPRLRAFVRGLRQGGVVSVVAGPGYGKTAFLVDTLSASAAPRAYLSLDEGDKDPARFLDYLIRACETAHPGLGEAARARLDECVDVRREALHVVAALLAEIASYAGVPTVLALDDVHCVDECEPVVSALAFLVDGLPPGWTLLFASRRGLPFPLSEIRQMGRLAEIDLRRLRLTPSEVEEWARKGWGGNLSLAEARTLWRLTEGWPVALVLLGQKLQQGRGVRVREEVAGLSRQGRHLNQYLADSVFRSLDCETAAVLRMGALVSRLVFPRDLPLFADFAQRAEAIFEELVQRGFLVTQTGHRTYTLHRLMRSFVAREAHRKDPDGANRATRFAADHLARVGELRQAISLYLQAGAAREAVGPLRALAASHLDASSVYACEEWLDLLPADVQAVEPWLLLLRARILQGRGECREAADLYRLGARLFEADDDRAGLLQARVGQAFCLYMTGRWEDSLEALSRAERAAVTDDERAEVEVNTGNVLLSQCRWDEAVERYERALLLARGHSRAPLEVRVFASRARLFFLRGRYGLALEWARRAIARSSNEARAGYASSLNAAATLLYLVARYDDATIQAEAALALVRARGYVFLEPPVLLSLAGVRLGENRVRDAVAHIKKAHALSKASQDLESELWAEDMLGDVCRRNRNPEKAVAHHQRVLDVVQEEQLSMFEQVRALCGLGMDLAVLDRPSDSRAALERAADLARRWGFEALLSQSLFYLGWLYGRSGAEHSAGRALTEAARIAGDQRHLHFFIQEAPVATPILALCARHGCGPFVASEIVPRLNARLQAYFAELAFGDTYPTDVPLANPRRPRMTQANPGDGGRGACDDQNVSVRRIEELTPRELQILRMISAGMANKVIATKLFITEKTVKTHANRIFRKLEVTNRLQAVLALQQHDKLRGGAFTG